MKLRTAVAAAVACIALAVPSSALAISPTQDAYGGIAGQQQGGGGGSPTSSDSGTTAPVAQDSAPVATQSDSSGSSGGSLPFTGFELGVVALVGFAMLGGGVVLYRVSRQRSELSG
jgi:hypothetical protein